MAGKTVWAWEKVHKMGLIFKEDNISVTIKEDPDFPFAFIVKVYEGDGLVYKDIIKYEEVGVNNMNELREKLIETLEKVTGIKYNVVRTFG